MAEASKMDVRSHTPTVRNGQLGTSRKTVAQYGSNWTFMGLFAGFLVHVGGHPGPGHHDESESSGCKDCIRNELDYKVNIWAEPEITELLKKVDNLGNAINDLAGRLPVKQAQAVIAGSPQKFDNGW